MDDTVRKLSASLFCPTSMFIVERKVSSPRRPRNARLPGDHARRPALGLRGPHELSWICSYRTQRIAHRRPGPRRSRPHRRRSRSPTRPRMAQSAGHRRRRTPTLFLPGSLAFNSPRHRLLCGRHPELAVGDVIIRQQTKGAKSIDDFCKLFHGAPSSGPTLRTYTFDDVVNTLTRSHPTTGAASGPIVLPITAPVRRSVASTAAGGRYLQRYALGNDECRGRDVPFRRLRRIGARPSMRDDGSITDTIEAKSPAKAGIGPGMKVVAVNGRRYSPDVLRDAIKSARRQRARHRSVGREYRLLQDLQLDYTDGEMYPHLVRDESKPDLLTEILKSK